MGQPTRFYVVGDTGQATLVYAEDGFDLHAPSRRHSWRAPRQIGRFTTPGVPGTVVRMLRELGDEADSPANPEGNAESVYILRPYTSNLTDGERAILDEEERLASRLGVEAKKGLRELLEGLEQKLAWRVQHALVCGELDHAEGTEPFRFARPDAEALRNKERPLVVLEYNQVWRRETRDGIPAVGGMVGIEEAYGGRSFLIRTHDPLLPEWDAIHRLPRDDGHVRIWFSPLQDLADGSLDFPGTWGDLGPTVERYLRTRPLTTDDGRWRDHIVVQVYEDGVFWCEAGTDGIRAIVCPGAQPRSLRRRIAGDVMGSGVLFTTALARALKPHEPMPVREAIERGLHAVRELRRKGYRSPKELANRLGRRAKQEQDDRAKTLADDRVDGFADDRVEALANDGTPPLGGDRADLLVDERPRSLVDDRVERREDGRTIYEGLALPQDPEPLRSYLPEGRWLAPDKLVQPVAEQWYAKELVTAGKDEFDELLTLRLGDLAVADPAFARTLLDLTGRLEAFRDRWREAPDEAGILSLAIFGEPGSGKSFIAKQLAAAVDPGNEVFKERSFNVSQFTSPSDLVDALQEVVAVSQLGRLPLVLWDEFDTRWDGQPGGWLSSFLMPMQDQKFVVAGHKVPLGSAVFVFIGGTFPNDHRFKKEMKTPDGRNRKLPDFHSRLESSFSAPTVRFTLMPDGRAHSPVAGRANRAVLVRVNLRKKFPELKQIDSNVLSLLLHVPLEHGARSLEKLVESSASHHSTVFRLHQLPPDRAAAVHVARGAWKRILRRMGEASEPWYLAYFRSHENVPFSRDSKLIPIQ